MPNLRRATPEDAELIVHQRHIMFADNQLATEARFEEMDQQFLSWVRLRLADARYVGLLLEEDGQVLAGAGIFFADFPPHFLDVQPCRPYLLNFYTAPQARGRGYANLLLRACVDECASRGAKTVVLHASPFGKPIYEKFGFEQTNEMMLKLGDN